MSPMRLTPRSVRARVTAVFVLGAAATLALCLTLLYLTLARELQAALAEDLVGRGDDLSAALSGGDIGAVARDPLAQVYGVDGAVLAGSSSLGGRRLLPVGAVRGVTGQVLVTRSVPLGSNGRTTQVQVLARRIAPDGGVLAVGVSESPVHAARQRLIVVLLVAAPLLVAALAAAGFLVVRAVLRPVDLLTREAAEISSVDTDRRLPAASGDDEIARLARTLDGMLARLQAAFARERAFVDDASHELRTPIAVLRGEIELALSAVDDPDEVARSLRAALGEAERLSRLAEDLLLLARERAGSLVFHQEPVDLLDLAAAEAGRLQRALGVRIEVSGDPAVIAGDADRIRQVIADLADNSAGAGASTVRIHVVDDRTSVSVEMADDGPGFPPGVVGSAFERFVRGDDARTRGSGGAGLGLSIVRAIVTAHGGTVEARNGGPLGGAVVTFRLPLS